MTNAAGYYPGPVAPSTADGAPLREGRHSTEETFALTTLPSQV